MAKKTGKGNPFAGIGKGKGPHKHGHMGAVSPAVNEAPKKKIGSKVNCKNC